MLGAQWAGSIRRPHLCMLDSFALIHCTQFHSCSTLTPYTVYSTECVVHLPSTRGISIYCTQVWSASEALPSTIGVSCTINESRALVEVLPVADGLG
jgi:hypothetical protein